MAPILILLLHYTLYTISILYSITTNIRAKLIIIIPSHFHLKTLKLIHFFKICSKMKHPNLYTFTYTYIIQRLDAAQGPQKARYIF